MTLEMDQLNFRLDTFDHILDLSSNVIVGVDKFYKGFEALQPEDIADLVYYTVSRPKHVNIADVLVFSTAQANNTIVNKAL